MGKQLKIHGNVVCVPADVSTTVSMLPRTTSDMQTIAVKLKRRSRYDWGLMWVLWLTVTVHVQHKAKTAKSHIYPGINISVACHPHGDTYMSLANEQNRFYNVVSGSSLAHQLFHSHYKHMLELSLLCLLLCRVHLLFKSQLFHTVLQRKFHLVSSRQRKSTTQQRSSGDTSG